MRAASMVFLIPLLSLVGWAQQSGGQQPATHHAHTPVTISGCLTGLNGAFILTNDQGERFVLKGHQNAMFNYNGKQVQVTGTPKAMKKDSNEPQPGPFHVSSIEQLAEVCH